jgi:hypothetical protein
VLLREGKWEGLVVERFKKNAVVAVELPTIKIIFKKFPSNHLPTDDDPLNWHVYYFIKLY